MHSNNILLLISSTILVSYLSSLVYTRTRIPDIILLMFFGLTIGPVLEIFDKTIFLELAPMMSVLALSIILFEAGINVNIEVLIDMLFKSSVLSVSSILGSMLVLGFALSWLMPGDFTFAQGMLLGAMVGGTSTVSTYGVLSGLDRKVENVEKTRVLLTVESVLSDPICIITSLTIIKTIMLPDVSFVESLKDIFDVFTLSSIFGLAVGLTWARVLSRLRKRPFLYMITLAVLLPVYILSERYIGEGAGAMSALTFGLALSNFKYIMNRFGRKERVMIDVKKLRGFHEEITFFIKSFFFVYIGLVVSLSVRNFVIGAGITLLLMGIRYVIVEAVAPSLNLSHEEKTMCQCIYASGLPAFVMSQLPMIYDPAGAFFTNPGIYQNLAMPIVLGTVIYSSLVGQRSGKQLLAPPPAPKETQPEGESDVEGEKPVKPSRLAQLFTGGISVNLFKVFGRNHSGSKQEP